MKGLHIKENGTVSFNGNVVAINKEFAEYIKQYQEALEFYASGYEVVVHEHNGKYYTVIEPTDCVIYDEGKTACNALEQEDK